MEKYTTIAISILTLICCNSKNNVIVNNELIYKNIIDSCVSNNNRNINFNKNSKFGIGENLKKLKIDDFHIVFSTINEVPKYTLHPFEKFDSLAFFIIKSKSIIPNRKTIVYDFTKKARGLVKDTFYQNANTDIVRLNERIYLVKEGFD
jgi:hypothetical protein